MCGGKCPHVVIGLRVLTAVSFGGTLFKPWQLSYLCDINMSLGQASPVQEFLESLGCLGVEEALNNGVFWLKEGYIVPVYDARIVQ